MLLTQFLILAAVLFGIGMYGVLVRRNGVLVLMSVELMLNAVNLNLIAFSAHLKETSGQVFALFVITIAAAEVGVGLAIVLLIYRNRKSINLDKLDEMLAAALKRNTNAPVFVTADRDTLHGQVNRVLDRIRRAGVQRVFRASGAQALASTQHTASAPAPRCFTAPRR